MLCCLMELVFTCLPDGEGMAYGGLLIPGMGCPVFVRIIVINYTVKNNVSHIHVVVLKDASLHISLSNTICDYFNIH